MKLLVTGGCGFIGSNFIRHVLQSRAGKVSIVNLFTSVQRASKDTAVTRSK
jgi:dTDP-D-glucose 4,6-dehydratase